MPEALSQPDIQTRRKANRILLSGLMHPPRIALDIAEAFEYQYESTKDAMAIGLGLGFAPVNSPMLLSSIDAFTTEMRQVIGDYPRTRRIERGKVVYSVRERRHDRPKEEGAALTIIEGLEVVTEDLPIKEARETAAELTAKLYIAAIGQGAGVPLPIDKRLEGVGAFTRLGFSVARRAAWQLPVDPLPVEQPKTVRDVLDQMDALLADE